MQARAKELSDHSINLRIISRVYFPRSLRYHVKSILDPNLSLFFNSDFAEIVINLLQDLAIAHFDLVVESNEYRCMDLHTH